MLTVGLTGPTGSGKGFVSAVFAESGIPSIDTDAVYHDMLIPPSDCLDTLVAHFGNGILNVDGTLNRRALSEYVFNPENKAGLDWLSHTTHRMICDRVRDMIGAMRGQGIPAVLIDAPLLYESGFDAECDFVIAVLAPLSVRRERIKARDGIDDAAADRRISSQKPDGFYTAGARYVLRNDGNDDASRLALVRSIRDIMSREGMLCG